MTSPPSATRRSSGSGSIAVTGSKGGVGKSNLVLNLALSLGRNGRRVLLVDGDLGLANLDILLGLIPDRTVEHFLRGEATFDELLVEGPCGVRILPAASGIPQFSRLDESTRACLLTALDSSLNRVDDVLVDTGAGLGETTLSLQLAATRVIVVTTVEPTSLVDAYASIKVLWHADPEKRIDLVVSNVASDEEAARSHDKIAQACRHFLGRAPGLLGTVYNDPKVPEAVRRQRAVLDLFPTSRAARCYERIALRIVMQPVTEESPAPYWHRLATRSAEEAIH